MSALDRYQQFFRKLGPGGLDFCRELGRHMDLLSTQTGSKPLQFIDAPPAGSIGKAVPPLTQFYVTGAHGTFRVVITAPQNVVARSGLIAKLAAVNGKQNWQAAPIVYNLQSALDLNFNNSAASGVTDYGLAPQTSYTIQQPSTTLYWRVRASYDGINFNQWQVFPNAVASGT